MAKKKTILEQMEANPRGDWSVQNIETLCSQVGLVLKLPSHGIHYKVTSDILNGTLTVPFKRLIKAFYIKEMVGFSKAHIAAMEARKRKGD